MDISVFTDINGRDENQDTAAVKITQHGLLAVVCDGMGGLTYGRETAELALKLAIELCEPGKSLNPSDGEDDPIDIVNRRIREFGRNCDSRLGTTICACTFSPREGLHVRWLGDSRLYVFQKRDNHPGRLVTLTRDNNKATEAYLNNYISEATWRVSSDKNKLTEFLGARDSIAFQYDFVPIAVENEPPKILGRGRPFPLTDKDVVILCSDGAVGNVSEENIAELAELSSYGTYDMNQLGLEICSDAKKGGSTDNQTIICFKIPKVVLIPDEDNERESKWCRYSRILKMNSI